MSNTSDIDLFEELKELIVDEPQKPSDIEVSNLFNEIEKLTQNITIYKT